MIKKELTNTISDISNDVQSDHPVKLEKVGMQNIELPILLEQNGQLIRTPAKIDIFINLKDPLAKGIHMSRLFLSVQEHLTTNTFNDNTIKKLLEKCVDTHSNLSDEAFIKIDFDFFTEREALVSKNKGWKSYPISVSYKLKDKKITRDYSISATYSSTCPCSAALARQDVQQTFLNQHNNSDKTKFSKEEVFDWLGKETSISATPHAQRSTALVKVKNSSIELNFLGLINLVEDTLKTTTQAAVKREDEQEFARLNATNLMFCEDAAKKLKMALDNAKFAEDFYIKVCHFESLHPHDATAITVKGIPNGYQA